MRIATFLLSLLVSLLPEKAKAGRLQPCNTVGAHIVSGIVEAVAAGGLLVREYLAFIIRFTDLEAGRLMDSTFEGTEAQVQHMGVVGWFSFLFRPWTWILAYHLVEGGVRAIEAAINGGTRGTALLYFVFRIAGLFTGTAEHAGKRAAIGPRVSDRVLLYREGAALLIESVDDFPWWEHQVLRYRDTLYQMTSRSFEKTGQHHRHRYQFRLLQPNEIVRGAVIEYPPAPGDVTRHRK
ncbi:MAG: hypothetical protein ACR2L2_16045 [Acidobacteriota bacterium]